MSIIFFGDPHFDSQTPASRIDNYAEVSVQKLKAILEVAIEKDAKHVMSTGDFFDKYDVSFSYLNELVAVLKEFQDADIKVWSLIGNHDLPYNSMSYFKNTPLNTLFKSGLVKHIKEKNEFHGFTLAGLDFTKLDRAAEINKEYGLGPSILIAHYAMDNTVPGESINFKDVSNFDIVISGHDHMYYKPKTLESGTRVLRPGSLLRRTKEEYNLTRDVVIYYVSRDYDNTFGSWAIEEIKLPGARPASEIFRNEVFDEAAFNLYDNKYNDLFNKDYFEDAASDIFAILGVLPSTVSKRSKDAVVKYLKTKGIRQS